MCFSDLSNTLGGNVAKSQQAYESGQRDEERAMLRKASKRMRMGNGPKSGQFSQKTSKRMKNRQWNEEKGLLSTIWKIAYRGLAGTT